MSNEASINAWSDRAERAVKQFERGPRGRILRKAARPVVVAARSTSAFPDRTGTLRRSLDRIPGLRRSPSEFVGPRAGKRALPGKDGYYAQFLFSSSGAKNTRRTGGKAIGFRRAVLEPAIRAGGGAAINIIITEARREIRKQASKNNVR